jgi:formate dehydrogenase subunit delta
MSAQKLVRMANEIARNFRTLPDDQPAAATANHLKSFWTPSMCAAIIAHVDAGGAGLDAMARDAVVLLRSTRTK